MATPTLGRQYSTLLRETARRCFWEILRREARLAGRPDPGEIPDGWEPAWPKQTHCGECGRALEEEE